MQRFHILFITEIVQALPVLETAWYMVYFKDLRIWFFKNISKMQL